MKSPGAQRSPRPALGEAPVGGVPRLAPGTTGPRLQVVIIRPGCFVLALLCLFTMRPASADDAMRREAGVRRHRGSDLSVYVPRGAGTPAAWLASGMPARLGRDRRGAPVCAGEVCQPRVAVPGHDPKFRGGRTDVVLALLSRSPLRPVSKVARYVADSNVRVDFSPSLGQTSERGWGRLVVSLRWRLDASNAPATRRAN